MGSHSTSLAAAEKTAASSGPVLEATHEQNFPRPCPPCGSSGLSSDAWLCEYCQALKLQDGCIYRKDESRRELDLQSNFELKVEYNRTDVMPGFPSVTATAKAGCCFCKMIVNSQLKEMCAKQSIVHGECKIESVTLEWHHTPPAISNCTLYVHLIRNKPWKPCLVSFCWIESNVNIKPNFKADMNITYPPEPGVEAGRLFESYRSEKGMGLMRRWISNCEAGCHPTLSRGTVPTRLIDVGTSENPLDKIRLVHMESIFDAFKVKYVALSHCWGPRDRPPLTTTHKSLDERLHQIPLDVLPRNYQDAVTFTRGLCVRYLWIDSLCIIQDSIDDWEKESMQMHDIYQQAYVTLIVAKGDNCHDGFLDVEPPPTMVELQYRSMDPDYPVDETYWLREYRNPVDETSWIRKYRDPVNETYWLREYRSPVDEILLSPWSKRGWTFQESEFSTRKVYFTPSTVAYHCGDVIKAAHDRSRWSKSAEGVTDRLKDAFKRYSKSPADFYWRTWYKQIEDYSARILTFPQDRLPAIAASAKLLAESKKDKYLAGLWDNELYLWLAWNCSGVRTTAQTLAERLRFATHPNFIAPSWSWASQTRGVHWHHHGSDGLARCEILECSATPKGLNPYGGVASGHLRVSGMMRSIPDFDCIEWCKGTIKVFCANNLFELRLDWWEPSMETGVTREADTAMLGHLLLLRLARFTFTYTGILLMSTGKQNEYLRVGMFDFWFCGNAIYSEHSEMSEEDRLLDQGWEKRIITIV